LTGGKEKMVKMIKMHKIGACRNFVCGVLNNNVARKCNGGDR